MIRLRLLIVGVAVLSAAPAPGIEPSATVAAVDAVSFEAQERGRCVVPSTRSNQVGVCLLQSSFASVPANHGSPDGEAPASKGDSAAKLPASNEDTAPTVLNDSAAAGSPTLEGHSMRVLLPAAGDDNPHVMEAMTPLRLELHVRFSLADLHTKFGPLPEFVVSLQTVLADAVGLPSRRFRFLDIRGYPVKLPLVAYGENETAALEAVEHATEDVHADAALITLTAADLALRSGGALVSAASSRGFTPEMGAMDPLGTSGDGEIPAAVADMAPGGVPLSILDFEVLPGEVASDPTPQMYFTLLQEQLRDPEGQLMSSDLAEALDGATILLALPPAGSAGWEQREEVKSGAPTTVIASLIVAGAMLVV